MRAPSSDFNEFLAEGESVVTGAPGTLIDSSSRSEGSIGITDRRVLFLSSGGRFVDIGHDAISSIQSRSRATLTSDGRTYRLLVGLGALIAVAAFLGVIVFDSSVLALALMAVTVCATVGAELVRRFDSGRAARHEDLIVLGLVTVALTSLIGLIVLTESLFVVPLAMVALGGIVLGEYANQRRHALDKTGRSRRHEREVGIHLASGRSVYLRVDAGRRIDHDLSGVARESARTPAPAELPRSSA